MKISHLTQGDLISFKSVLGSNRPKRFPPHIDKMAYYAIKFGGEDGFKRVVGK